MIVQEAIILAGGLGTRLKKVVNEVPKVMAPVNGRPFLEYVLDYLNNNIFNHVVLSVGYKNEVIREHFGNKYKSVEIDYTIEDEPLGTGGGIKKAFEYIEGHRAVVLNGDTMFRINMSKVFEFHFSKKCDFSIVLREVENVTRYGAVEIDENHKVVRFNEKGKQTGRGNINGGVYIINKKFFNQNKFADKFSLEKDCFEKLIETYAFYGMVCKQYFLDIGIPKDYKRAQDEFKEFAY